MSSYCGLSVSQFLQIYFEDAYVKDRINGHTLMDGRFEVEAGSAIS